MLSARFRGYSDRIFLPMAEVLARSGVTPNSLTVLGLFVSIFTATAFANGRLLLAFCTFLVVGLIDALDGAVARVLGRTTRFGGLLDSALDRYSDCLILAGIAMYMEAHLVWVLFALSGSLLVSYSRAQAEIIIPKCDVGFAERAERLIILSAATLIQVLEVTRLEVLYLAVVVVAVLSHVTLLQRIHYTWLTS